MRTSIGTALLLELAFLPSTFLHLFHSVPLLLVPSLPQVTFASYSVEEIEATG